MPKENNCTLGDTQDQMKGKMTRTDTGRCVEQRELMCHHFCQQRGRCAAIRSLAFIVHESLGEDNRRQDIGSLGYRHPLTYEPTEAFFLSSVSVETISGLARMGV